jgi:phosphoserine phosphatase RsbU/P
LNEQLIRSVPFFTSLTDGEILHLAEALQVMELPAQAILFTEGQRDDSIYILLAGEVEIIKAFDTPSQRLLGRIGAGMIFGEMSLFSQEGRHTATVLAMTHLQLLKISRLEFEGLLNRHPSLAVELWRRTSVWLEDSENATILDLREKNRQLTQAYQELQAAQARIIETEKLEHELRLARQIQFSILPGSLPERPGLEFGRLMEPARMVGGDFYDFIPLEGNELGVVVGDVSDKGMPSALFMALTYSFVRAEALHTGSAYQALQKVNTHLANLESAGMFVTILLGILDCGTGEFRYARAGHPPPVVLDGQGRRVEWGSGLGQPLGVLDQPQLDRQHFTLPPGGLALFYSDGLTEAADAQGGDFGVAGVLEVLQAHRQSPAQHICEQLWAAINHFSAGLPQQDDVTLVVIKRSAG